MAAMFVKSAPDLDQLDANALRTLAEQVMGEFDETRQVVTPQAHDIHSKKLTYMYD